MKSTHTHACPIAAALNVLGDRWTLLIIREAFYGAVRFGEIRKNTGISKNILTDRLAKLVSEGILERVDFADRGTNFVYHLTKKGRSLDTVLASLLQWGNAHIYGEGEEPVLLVDCSSGLPVRALSPVDGNGQGVDKHNIVFQPGPGANSTTKRRLSQITRTEATG